MARPLLNGLTMPRRLLPHRASALVVVAALVGGAVLAGAPRAAYADDAAARPAEHAAHAAQTTPRTGPTSIDQLSLGRRADVSYAASPHTWKDEVVQYPIMVDRFNIGKVSTPENLQRQPDDPKGWHGGNINGITEKLDYLKGQGKTTIAISPVLGNGGAAGGYHGYWITDFLDTEKHFGTMKDLKNLVAEAHKRGMHVLLDIVVNHTGRVFEYQEPDTFGPGQKHVARWNTQMYPRELQNADNFSRRGTVTQRWDADETLNGDFIDGLRDFDLNKREVQDKFIKIYKYVIAETGVDGFRVDTVKHVPESFWPRFNREIKEYAATQLGMHNFGTFPEWFASTPHDQARITTPTERDWHHIDPNSTHNLGFTGTLDFTSYFGEENALRNKAPTRQIEGARAGLTSTLSTDQLTRQGGFIDNHDVGRFLSDDHGKVSELKAALARLYFRAGIPFIQYGTDQAIREVGKPTDNSGVTSRGDQFDGKFKWRGATGSSFNTSAPLYRIERLFKDVRDAYEPLRRGAEYARWSDPNGAGIYAFSRIHNGKEVVVVINTADEARSASNIWVDHDVWKNGSQAAGGAKLVDALHPSYTTNVGAVRNGSDYGGAQIGNVSVPPHGVRVLVADHDYVPTPLRNFDSEGREIAWHPSTVAAASRMRSVPSMDGATVRPVAPRFAPAAPAPVRAVSMTNAATRASDLAALARRPMTPPPAGAPLRTAAPAPAAAPALAPAAPVAAHFASSPPIETPAR